MNTGTATLMLMCLSVLAVRHTQAKALKTEVAKQDDVDILSSEASSAESGVKRKRSYYSPNQNYVSLLDASQVWRPATYTISRPYVIPVFSISNRYPIFYPPQSVYSNPGSPVDNPLKPPYQAPEYLPPKTTSKPNTDVGDRLGGDDDNDAPVWGTVEMVGMPLSGNVDKESEVTPTRAPRPSQSRPPLIHNTQSVTTTTTTPTPPPPRAASGPSNCVWAIVSCCSASSPKDYSNSCFEQRGCPGPFWGSSPCDGDFARAAIAAAVKYYGTSGK
ncbi:hadley isoform X2 [Rhynchophorus ferrugineus]